MALVLHPNALSVLADGGLTGSLTGSSSGGGGGGAAIVVQEFVNHGGLQYKAYVIGGKVRAGWVEIDQMLFCVSFRGGLQLNQLDPSPHRTKSPPKTSTTPRIHQHRSSTPPAHPSPTPSPPQTHPFAN